VEEPAKVIAHITLPGSAVRQMYMQKREDKLYLYLQQKAHFTIVDVTDPQKPTVIKRVESDGGSLESLGGGIALTIAPEKGAASASPAAPPTQVVKIMDLSDPKNPRVVRTFNGVTSVLPDDSRRLIFLANSDGLWVLRHRQPRPLPVCTSEDELTPNPDCF
jgi:hypothetical protein